MGLLSENTADKVKSHEEGLHYAVAGIRDLGLALPCESKKLPHINRNRAFPYSKTDIPRGILCHWE
jgi:hypothetical protein